MRIISVMELKDSLDHSISCAYEKKRDISLLLVKPLGDNIALEGYLNNAKEELKLGALEWSVVSDYEQKMFYSLIVDPHNEQGVIKICCPESMSKNSYLAKSYLYSPDVTDYQSQLSSRIVEDLLANLG